MGDDGRDDSNNIDEVDSDHVGDDVGRRNHFTAIHFQDLSQKKLRICLRSFVPFGLKL